MVQSLLFSKEKKLFCLAVNLKVEYGIVWKLYKDIDGKNISKIGIFESNQDFINKQ